MTDPRCNSCYELLAGDRHEHHHNRPVCDDCLFDAIDYMFAAMNTEGEEDE